MRSSCCISWTPNGVLPLGWMKADNVVTAWVTISSSWQISHRIFRSWIYNNGKVVGRCMIKLQCLSFVYLADFLSKIKGNLASLVPRRICRYIRFYFQYRETYSQQRKMQTFASELFARRNSFNFCNKIGCAHQNARHILSEQQAVRLVSQMLILP
jgi:hypothetical protein